MCAAYLKGPEILPIRAYAGCTGKVAFDSPALAIKAAKRKDNRKHYRCLICGKYHVGTTLETQAPRPNFEGPLVRYESNLVGKIAYWTAYVPGVSGFGSDAQVVGHELRRAGTILRIGRNGDCTVKTTKAVDLHCPADQEGKLLKLKGGTWSTTP